MESVNTMFREYESAIEIKALQLATEIIRLRTLLESNKPLYEKIDNLTIELKNILGGTEIEVVIKEEQLVLTQNGPIWAAPQIVKVVDNFADKNVVFRTAGVKRFELASETIVERNQRLEKETKKALKAASKK